MPQQQEQGAGDAPEGDELGVGGGHAVALAVDARRAVLLEEALEGEVDGLAGELAGEHERDFGFAREEDEGGVDDAEGLREEGEVGAEEGEFVVGILETVHLSVMGSLGCLGGQGMGYVEDVGDGERGEGGCVVHGRGLWWLLRVAASCCELPDGRYAMGVCLCSMLYALCSSKKRYECIIGESKMQRVSVCCERQAGWFTREEKFGEEEETEFEARLMC